MLVKAKNEGRFDTIPTWATRSPNIPPLARLVLIELITYDWRIDGKRKGYVFPSQRGLAELLMLDRKTVGKQFSLLIAIGAITVIQRQRGEALQVQINYGRDLTKAAQSRPLIEADQDPPLVGEMPDHHLSTSAPQSNSNRNKTNRNIPDDRSGLSLPDLPYSDGLDLRGIEWPTSAATLGTADNSSDVCAIPDEPYFENLTGCEEDCAKSGPSAFVAAGQGADLDSIVPLHPTFDWVHNRIFESGGVYYEDDVWPKLCAQYDIREIAYMAALAVARTRRGRSIKNPNGWIRDGLREGYRFGIADVESWRAHCNEYKARTASRAA
jgi:hypothetical protein